MQKYLILFIIAALAVMFIAGCRRKNDSKPVITVSIEPQRWLLERIGGERIGISVLMKGDADPENFDPPMSTMIDAASGAAFMPVGCLDWEKPVIERLRDSKDTVVIVNTSAGIDFIMDTHSHGDGCEHTHADPHVWSSVRNARIMAHNMLMGLLEVDPAGTEYYNTRYARLDSELVALDREYARRLKPMRDETFLVWHPSLSYFARDYGLHQVAMGQENKEISLIMMRQTLSDADTKNARVFFMQPQMDAGGKTDAVISRTGAVKCTVRPLAPDWKQEMDSIVEALVKNR